MRYGSVRLINVWLLGDVDALRGFIVIEAGPHDVITQSFAESNHKGDY